MVSCSPRLPDWLKPKGAFLRLEVDVTFLTTSHSRPWPNLPDGLSVRRLRNPSVASYRALYVGVGREYCWWMRQAMPDDVLGDIIGSDAVQLMVLRDSDGAPFGYYELDLRDPRDGQLAYFGLLPAARGRGLGRMLLDGAVAHAFASGVSQLRVNTCSQDHPAALPNYRRAGFEIVHVEREVWNVPAEYLPDRLRGLASGESSE